MGKRIVVLIDCQNDFIDGSLGVGYNKWIKAYNYIEENLLNGYDDYIFTKDDHPSEHCSFVKQGGLWDPHCIHNTFGAELYWKLISKSQLYRVVNKGQNTYEEEYGIDAIRGMVNVDEVNIAGLCLDYCVKESAIMIANAHPNTKVKVHLKGSAYIAEDTKNFAIEQMKKIPNIELIE